MTRALLSNTILSLTLAVALLLPVAAPQVEARSSDSANLTDQMVIEAVDRGDKLELTYLVDQVFYGDQNHGIYLALPKNQGGVWTSYELLGIQRSTRFEPASSSLENEQQRSRETAFQDEPYDQIKDWSELRVRIGKADRTLLRGWYRYKLTIAASKSANVDYPFTLLRDWGDPINKLDITYNGKTICIENNDYCDTLKPNYKLNPNRGAAKLPLFQTLLYETGPYLIGLLISYCLIFLLWYNFARDPSSGFTVDKPEFEPPAELAPWQAQYMVSEGKLNLKNTLLSYILWLNHQKLIKLTPTDEDKGKQTEQVKLEILKDLPPTSLPDSFNKAVKLIQEQGLQAGLLASKLNESQDAGKLNDTVYASIKQHYAAKPVYSSLGWALLVAGGLFFIGMMIFNFLQQTILLGNSWSMLYNIVLGLSFPGIWWLIQRWGKLTNQGYALRAYALRYKFYLEKAEQFKLDFSNNPEDGVQYYLKSVPFAAAFGILPKFNKYMAGLIPDRGETERINSFYAGWSATHLYVPPSSGSGGFGGGGGGFSGGGGSW